MLRKILVILVMGLIMIQCGEKPPAVVPVVTSITGTVKDASGGAPLQDVTISTNPSTEQVTTNAEGKYTIEADVTIGTRYTIIATKQCYQQNTATITVVEGKNRVADIVLSVIPPELSVTPETLDFGETRNSDHFVISNNSGCGELHWHVSPPQEPWLSVQEPLSGTIINQPHTVLVNVDRSRATASGTLTATIHITSVEGGSEIVNITIIVEIPFGVIITQGPQDEATVRTREVTFGWEVNKPAARYKYRVEGSGYYGGFRETRERSVVLKDLDESPPDVPDVFYIFTVIAIAEDGSESVPDQRKFRMDCIRGPAVWMKSRRVEIKDMRVNPGFCLNLMAEEVSDLLLANLIIRFDKDKLEVQPGGIEKGDFLTKNSDEGHLVFFPSDIKEAVTKANREGMLTIDMAILQKDRPPAVSGSGVLATIRFNARVNGQTTSVTFDGETKLRDSENTTMALSGRYGSTVEIK